MAFAAAAARGLGGLTKGMSSFSGATTKANQQWQKFSQNLLRNTAIISAATFGLGLLSSNMVENAVQAGKGTKAYYDWQIATQRLSIAIGELLILLAGPFLVAGTAVLDWTANWIEGINENIKQLGYFGAAMKGSVELLIQFGKGLIITSELMRGAGWEEATEKADNFESSIRSVTDAWFSFDDIVNQSSDSLAMYRDSLAETGDESDTLGGKMASLYLTWEQWMEILKQGIEGVPLYASSVSILSAGIGDLTDYTKSSNEAALEMIENSKNWKTELDALSAKMVQAALDAGDYKTALDAIPTSIVTTIIKKYVTRGSSGGGGNRGGGGKTGGDPSAAANHQYSYNETGGTTDPYDDNTSGQGVPAEVVITISDPADQVVESTTNNVHFINTINSNEGGDNK